MEIFPSHPESCLLAEIANEHAIDIIFFSKPNGAWWLEPADREALMFAIFHEFAETGVEPDGETNSRGLELEALWDRIKKF